MYSQLASREPDTEPMPAMDCTVIIPAYNAAAFIETSVRSALAQGPDGPLRVIVVDDESTDDTVARAGRIDGVEVIRKKNGGAAAARNAGLALATTRFVIFLDADDELLEGAVTAHASAMEAHPDAAMVFGSNYMIDSSGRRIAVNDQPPFSTSDAARIAYDVTPCPSQCMFRRSAVEEVGGYDGSLRSNEDVDLNLRLTRVGQIACHGAYVMNYRRHPEQATKRPASVCRTHLLVIRRALGPRSPSADAKGLHRALSKWKTFYGQHIPGEVAKNLLRGNLGAAMGAARTFMACLPQSGRGASRTLARMMRWHA